MMFCSKCGKPLGEGNSFCGVCGQKTELPKADAVQEFASEGLSEKQKRKKLHPGWLVGAGLVVGVLVVLVCVYVFFPGLKDSRNVVSGDEDLTMTGEDSLTFTTPVLEGLVTGSDNQPGPSGETGIMPSLSFDYPEHWVIESDTFKGTEDSGFYSETTGEVVLVHPSGLKLSFWAKVGYNGGATGAVDAEVLTKTNLENIALAYYELGDNPSGGSFQYVSLLDMSKDSHLENPEYAGGMINFRIANKEGEFWQNFCPDFSSEDFQEAVAIASTLRLTPGQELPSEFFTTPSEKIGDGSEILGSWAFVIEDGPDPRFHTYDQWEIDESLKAAFRHNHGEFEYYYWVSTGETAEGRYPLYKFSKVYGGAPEALNPHDDEVLIYFNEKTQTLHDGVSEYVYMGEETNRIF